MEGGRSPTDTCSARRCRISVAFPSHFFAFPSHFFAFPSHFVAFPSHFVAFPSHFVAFFAFLFHPLPAITAYITCPYARFPVNRLSHFSHFPAGLVPPSAGWPPPRRKNEERKMKIPPFLVFRSPTHRTMCPSTHDSVCAPRSISRQVANVKYFLKNL